MRPSGLKRARFCLIPWHMGLLAICPLLASCTPEPSAARSVVPEHAGCREQLADGTCILDDARQISVFAPKNAQLSWHSDQGSVREVGRVALADEARITLEVPARTQTLSAQNDDTRYALAIKYAPLQPVLSKALELKKSGQGDKARTLLEGAVELSLDDDVRRTWILGRLALGRGDDDTARTLLWQTAEQAAARGLATVAVDAAIVLGYLEAIQLHAPERADRALAFARAHADGYGSGLADIAYNEALSAQERGDLRRVLERLSVSEAISQRFGEQLLLELAQSRHAAVLRMLGRYGESLAIHRSLLARFSVTAAPDPASACQEADAYGSAGWTGISALGDATDDAKNLSAETASWLDASERQARSCDDAGFRSRNARVNLALFALTRGDLTGAKRELALAEQAGKGDAFTAPWSLEISGRIALSERRASAAQSAFGRELSLARASGDDEASWRSLVGLGRAHLTAAALEDAVQAFSEAERVLDRLVWAVPLGEGRGVFLDVREASAEGLVEALLALQRPAEAHAVGRHALARAEALAASAGMADALAPEVQKKLAALLERQRSLRAELARAAEDDWSLSDAALASALEARKAKAEHANALLDQALSLMPMHRPREVENDEPPAGTLRLTYLPLSQGLVAFAQNKQGTRVQRTALDTGAASAEMVGARLLEPFAREIARAERIEIRASGALRELDLHTLPLAHKRLLSYAPVVYMVEGAEASAPSLARPALVIADPTHALPHARAEGSLVARALERRGEVKLLTGEAAAREPVLSALARSDFVHFAGHGRMGDGGPLDPRLELAGQGTLAISDVLALPASPQEVVLSACEAGRAGEASVRTRTLGIAQAFVARGARAVVAPTRPVSDRASQALITRLYAAYDRDPDLVRALRSAQLELAGDESNTEWTSFRAWVPAARVPAARVPAARVPAARVPAARVP